MRRVAWGRLMRFGLIEMRLAPDIFWDLTPAELMFLAGTNSAGSGAMGRAGLEALMVRFPDGEEKREGKRHDGS